MLDNSNESQRRIVELEARVAELERNQHGSATVPGRDSIDPTDPVELRKKQITQLVILAILAAGLALAIKFMAFH